MMKDYVSTLMNVADNEIIEYCEFSRATGCTREDFRKYVNDMLYYAAAGIQYRDIVLHIGYPGRLSHLVLEMVTHTNYPSIDADLFINGRWYKNYKIAW